MSNLQHLQHRLQLAQEEATKTSNNGDYKALEHCSKEAHNIAEMIKYWEETIKPIKP